MKTSTKFLATSVLALLAIPVLAEDSSAMPATTSSAPASTDQPNRGERANARLDAKGARINARLDAKGNRIDNRLDLRGNRIERRFDRRHGE